MPSMYSAEAAENLGFLRAAVGQRRRFFIKYMLVSRCY